MPRAGLSTGAVVDAALGVIDEHGADALTLAAVAARTGVATPSLYKHVAGLGALRQKVSAAATAQLADELVTAVAGRAGVDAIAAGAHAWRNYAHSYPGRYPVTQRVPDPSDPDHVRAGERAVHAVYAVLRGYDLDGDAAVHATRMIRSSLHGFVTLEDAGGFGLSQDVDHTFALLISSLDAALRTWPRVTA